MNVTTKAATTVNVSLDRNIPVPGITYRVDRAYRLIGETGYADFLATGEIRPNVDRSKYGEIYFAHGVASSRYRRRRNRFDYVAEIHADLTVMAGGGTPRTGDYVRAVRTPTAADVTIYRIDNETGSVTVVHA